MLPVWTVVMKTLRNKNFFHALSVFIYVLALGIGVQLVGKGYCLICTHYPGHINLNIKLNAWMLSYILRETSISFLPEAVRYYNSRYISLQPVKIHQRKQSHLRSHNTSHSSKKAFHNAFVIAISFT